MMYSIKNGRVIGKKVLIQAYEWPTKIGSIWIPETLQYSHTRGGKDPWRGKILAVGGEVTQVKVGEIVRYQPNNYYKQTILEDEVRYIVLEELLIYAVEDEKENLVRALKDRVVFLPDEQIVKRYGRIYLPQRHEEKLLYGTIVVAGVGAGVEPGDRVVIENKSTWQYFDSAGKGYILTDRFNLIAKVEA